MGRQAPSPVSCGPARRRCYHPPRMRILHLAAGNRWTGAAAPAFAEVEALRGAGVDAHYAYVGGYKLEAKLAARRDFAHPLIAKAQNPVSFFRSVAAIGQLLDHHGFDVVHAHLTYDHWLARAAVRGRQVRVARTFHARRVLRRDPFTRSLLNATDLVCVINDTFAADPAIAHANPVFTPPPLDERQFGPEGADVREAYGIAAGAPLLTVIGKLSQGRGFEAALETFALVRAARADARLMIIGHGEHRPALEAHAATLGITPAVVWAGYHEEDLAEHYRAADILLFAARGSDEGHRAILEAMACATIPATYPIDGIPALLGPLTSQLMAASSEPAALAQRVLGILDEQDFAQVRDRVHVRAGEFGYDRAAARLIAAYGRVRNGRN